MDLIKGLLKKIEETGKIELSESFKKDFSKTIDTLVEQATSKKDAEITEVKGVLKEAKTSILKLQNDQKILKEATVKVLKSEKESYKNGLVEKLDRFLDAEIKNVVPQTLIEAAAKVKVYEPLVESIKNTFAMKGIEVDSKGFGILKEAKDEITKMRKDLNKVIAEKIELEKHSEKLLTKYLLEKKCTGLTLEQKERVSSILKGASLDEMEKKFEGVRNLVVEGNKIEKKDKSGKTVIVEKVDSEKALIVEKTEDLGAKYV